MGARMIVRFLSNHCAKRRVVMRVLGLETSCDETGVAVFDTDHGLLSHRLYSQIAVHAEYGGVVPELASRDHVRKTVPLIHEALAEANMSVQDRHHRTRHVPQSGNTADETAVHGRYQRPPLRFHQR